MPFEQDKIARIIAWVFDDEVEFLVTTASISNEFETDGPNVADFIAPLVGCLEPDRDVNLTDRFRYMKKIQFLTGRNATAEAYYRNSEDELGWHGGQISIDQDDLAGIVFSPDYPTLTDHTFADWMYQGASESADVLLAIRPTAGAQDWHAIFTPQEGTNILDSEGDVVMSPALGVPFKTGTSTQYLIKARRYQSGPICTDNDLGPGIEANLTGTIGGEETAHTIGVSWGGLNVEFDDDTEPSGGVLLPSPEWEPVGFAVSPEQNATAIQILLAPVFAE